MTDQLIHTAIYFDSDLLAVNIPRDQLQHWLSFIDEDAADYILIYIYGSEDETEAYFGLAEWIEHDRLSRTNPK